MIVNLLLLFLTDAGESALIKKLPPDTTYAHFRKRSGATANVIGKNKILIGQNNILLAIRGSRQNFNR